METLSLIGLILAIAVLVIGAYRGLGALPLTLLAGLVVIITSGMPIWQSFADYYMTGYTGAYLNFFLLFVASATYAELMNGAGAAAKIGYKFIDWFGRDKVLLVSLLMIALLTYGGISLFVVVFAVGPIMFLLFEEANIPRHLTMGALIGGSATFTMTALPGSPQLTNVAPTQYLGTDLTAAPVFGILASVFMFLAIMWYLNNQLKKARNKGEQWTNPENSILEQNTLTREELPNTFNAFAPLIALVLIIVIGSYFVDNSTQLAIIAMIIGAILTYVLNISKFKGKNMIEIITKGTGSGVASIGGLAAVVAFGAVVQNSPGYANIVDWLLSLEINPYAQGVIATGVISGVTGSSSGGLLIMLQSLGEHFIASGANLELLHRITSIAAGSLDTLPHSSGLFVMFPALGLTHKEAYKHVFVISVIIPMITVLLGLVYIYFIG